MLQPAELAAEIIAELRAEGAPWPDMEIPVPTGRVLVYTTPAGNKFTLIETGWASGSRYWTTKIEFDPGPEYASRFIDDADSRTFSEFLSVLDEIKEH